MPKAKFVRLAVLAAWARSAGCTAMRELPRADYAARPQRKGVRVQTREGLVYEFDSATFDPDSLTGYRLRSELDGPVDEVAVVRVALDDITSLRTRAVDWYRTGLVGGSVLAGVIAVGLVQVARNNGGDSSPDPVCSRCTLPSSTAR
jgi:hypothetical protein